MVQLLSTFSDFQSKISSSSLVVVDYFAQWCSPCVQIAPKIDQLALVHTDVQFYKVDVDEAQDIANWAKISAMPTFHFYKNGQLLDKVVGANLTAIKQKIQQYTQ